MSEAFVSFDGVWKKYRRGEHHDTIRDLLLALGRRRFRTSHAGTAQDEFWAVRDVSFDVRPGETLGIIGANGAGKSTVLKLLTKILRPNRGSVRVEGRIGALIEVSGGFHPDLTGRENIYLQGALMGMRRGMIREKFDQIVEFSGIEQFLDTPVKRYSSGMNARLGFSIAAHLDPDVLIIDEVLAVGDFRFQQRAFGRLQELARGGRPVVVVSHQLDRIEQLCSKAILMVAGQVQTAGTPGDCISAYLNQSGATSDERVPVALGVPRIVPRQVAVGEPFTATIPVSVRGKLPSTWALCVRVRALKEYHLVLFATSTLRHALTLPEAPYFELTISMRANLLPGQFSIEFYLSDRLEGREVGCSSPGLLQVTGQGTAIGRAHLDGRMVMHVPERGPGRFQDPVQPDSDSAEASLTGSSKWNADE